METALTITKSHRIQVKTLVDLLIPALLALIFFAFAFSYYPFREKLQYNTDEGLNLMRSMLVELGYPLYSEVSSDQAPLFTYLLGFLFRVVGFEVNPARTLVLLFSTLLVWSGAQFMQLNWGSLSSVMFFILVVLLPRYIELSVSVMIGIPSIALGALAMLLVTLWHRDRRTLWLVLSALVMALSIFIKLFTGFLAVIFLLGITVAEFHRLRSQGLTWKFLQPAVIWGVCFASFSLLLGLILVGPQNINELVFSHYTATSSASFRGQNYMINTHLQAAVPFLILACFGTLISIFRRQWMIYYPLAWAVFIYIFLNFYSPVFYHHQLLVTIPLALLGASSGQEIVSLVSLVRDRRFSSLISPQSFFAVGAVAVFALIAVTSWPVLQKQLMDRPRLTGFSLTASAEKMDIFRSMQKYADQTNWVVTDMPLYAFLIKRPVPPILATISRKRLVTGSLTEQDILAAMEEYHPEQVFLARFEFPALDEYLKKDYTLILLEEFKWRLFVRNDLN